MSYDIYIWRRRDDSSAPDARIFAWISQDLETPEIEQLEVDAIATELDASFPGWRSDETPETLPFICELDQRLLIVETYPSTPPNVFAWFRAFADRRNLTLFDPQIQDVPREELQNARREAARLRKEEVRERSSRAFHDLLRRAIGGDFTAQCEVGNAYSFGEGVRKSYKDAAKWYRAAAENGSTDGMFNWATCLRRGEGVDADMTSAIEWYTKAAEKDPMLATFALGEIYLSGEGVRRDDEKARHFFEIALEHEHPDARAALRMINEPVITSSMKKAAWKFWTR